MQLLQLRPTTWCAVGLLLTQIAACQQVSRGDLVSGSQGKPLQANVPTSTVRSQPIPPLPEKAVVAAAGLESVPVAPPLELTTAPRPGSLATISDPLKKAGEEPFQALPAKLIFEGSPQAAELPQPPSPIRPPPRPLALAFEAFLAHRPDEALRHLQSYSPKDQEIVMRLLPLLAAVDQGGVLSDRPKTQQVEQYLMQLQEVEQDLRPHAPLILQRLTLCHEIKSFGRFVPVKSAHFQPGESKWLYAEVLNLTDRRMKDGFYAVRLKGMIEIFGPDGKPVGPVELMHSEANHSASPRHDYFVRMDFRVPAQLQPGQYLVRVRIDDLDTGRSAQSSLPFQVVPPR